VQAQEIGGVVRVSIPATMTRAEERHWVDVMLQRLQRRGPRHHADLETRATALARRYGLPQPGAVRWADNHRARWGSCTPSLRTIRISSRLASEPPWVLDYVLVHELAHLSEPGHGRRFWRLVERYPKAERARGWLMARGLEPDD
jgi:predicted metal-dependent hydrolase